VAEIFEDSGGEPRTYGSPRVHAELRDQGWRVTEKTVAASMAREGLVARPQRRFRCLTRPDKRAVPFPDLVRRDFSAPAPNVKWCGDMTEIPTLEGKLYLADVEDLFSRRIVGFAIGEHPDAELATAAIQTAVASRGGSVAAVIFHSDRGSTYTADAFTEACDHHRIRQSMGRTGSCLDKTLVSYCTSWCRFDVDSVGEPAAHAFNEPGVAGGGRLVEPFVLVVGLVGDEQAGAVPGLDGGGVHAEPLGDLAEGEHAAGAEAFGVAGQPVAAA
jgi:transposase InsO family protein